MKTERYVMAGFIIVVFFVILCGCTTTAPSAETGKTNDMAGPATDSGLRIITEEQYPFNYAGANGTVTGPATDVVRSILTRQNQTAEISILPWSEGYSIAQKGPGVALYSTVRTDDREHLFKWVGPIASYDYILYAKNGTRFQINSLESAKKAGRICVVKDDFRHQLLLENQFDNISTSNSDAECIRNLMAGSADLWIGSSANAFEIAQNEGVDPSELHETFPVRSVQTYIAFSPDTPDSVINAWQNALDAMKSDGTFANIQKQYGLTTPGSAAVPASSGEVADGALNTMVAKTDGKMKVILRPFEVLALTSEVQSGDWNKIQPLLATLQGKEPDAWIWYALPDGSYYTVADGLTSANLKSRSYFPDLLAGKESVGVVVVSHTTGRNAGIVAVPVIKGGAVQSALGASVYLDNLTDELRQDIPEPFVFYAIDTEGKFAIHSEKGQISRTITTIGPDTSFGKAITTIRATDSGTVEYDDGGIHYMADFRSSPLTSWKFVVAWPRTGNTGLN
ncbi:MAG: transporter substrate-binding domain-containing protein [Methanoregula sp.]